MDDLRKTRIRLGITQQQLAKNAEVSHVAISNIENGYTFPQSDVRRRLEMVLNQRIDWMSTIRIPLYQDDYAWEEVEKRFRQALINITGLPKDQQSSFIEVAYQYLSHLKALLEKKNQAPEIVKEFRAIKPNRKNNKFKSRR